MTTDRDTTAGQTSSSRTPRHKPKPFLGNGDDTTLHAPNARTVESRCTDKEFQ